MADVFHDRARVEKSRTIGGFKIESTMIKHVTRMLTGWKVVERLLMEMLHEEAQEDDDSDMDAICGDSCPRLPVYPFKSKVMYPYNELPC